MAGDGHPTWHGESNDFGPNDGVARRRRFPSRGFLIGVGAAVMFVILLAVMGAIAAGSPSEGLVLDADYTTDLTAELPEADGLTLDKIVFALVPPFHLHRVAQRFARQVAAQIVAEQLDGALHVHWRTAADVGRQDDVLHPP